MHQDSRVVNPIAYVDAPVSKGVIACSAGVPCWRALGVCWRLLLAGWMVVVVVGWHCVGVVV